MSDFRFANPDWSAALWVVLVIVVLLLWLDHRRGGALSRMMSPLMQSRLVSRPSLLRRFLAIIFLGISAACLVVALMRPQFGLTYVKSPRVGAQIMFCLDVSKSMLAEDTAPNRLERAKADITDLLSFLDGDQVGLIGFAGRASVLCPLTPDYGFFKLILDNANPSSVGRGGTRLEEPIRKALDGFRTESDVSRIVVLITDGEDHDSHPLDVAKEAVDRGIKVVAVGLGDEAGSEIRITDPRTGVQSQVRDADGNPVITRLDGETLRELALATEGVYIPAGTGSLDLKSIYDAHIQPLVRGQMQAKGRAIRRDAFQWAILAGFVFLLINVVLSSGGAVEITDDQAQSKPNGFARSAMLLAMLSTALPNLAHADQQKIKAAAKSDQTTASNEQPNPREIYNRGLKQLRADFDEAESLLTMARRDAATDGEVRYRATYNMGWVEANRADALIDEQPEQALEHLQLAAGWFRDAVRLRKDSPDARHNLEVVLLRILQLRDQLSQKNDRDLAVQLDALITSQRGMVGQLRILVEQVAASDSPNISDDFRSQFQRLAVDQRVALSDLQDVVDNAASELDTLNGKGEAERTPEDNVRLAQLDGVLNYANQSSQRIGQSRSQLRRRQASRAFRRAAAGLNELKRARDQLRSPLEILDGLLADATTIAQQTALKSLDKQIVAADVQDSLKVPSWLDQDYLADGQRDLTGRTEELTNRLAAGLESQQTDPSTDSQQPGTAGEQQQFLARLRDAMPHLQRATEAMKLAGEAIGLPEYSEASDQQVRAIKALQEAREQFADIRGLIELAYATESQILDALDQESGTPEEQDENGSAETTDDDGIVQDQVVGLVTANQAKNLTRMERLKQEIAKELAHSKAAAVDPDADPPPQPSTEEQRLELASTLADAAIEQMEGVAGNLLIDQSKDIKDDADDTSNQDTDDVSGRDMSAAKSDAQAAVETLTELRRLFFSIAEHLQETAKRQAQLNDDTEQLAGTQNESNEENKALEQQSAPLASRQNQLEQIAKQIAETLEQQANQSTSPNAQGATPDPQQQEMIEQNAEHTKQAAELVSDANEQMKRAGEQLGAQQPSVAEARPFQDAALEKLIEALRTLQPPQQDQAGDQQQQSQENQQQDQQQQQSGEQDQAEQQSEQDAQKMDPSRVLQAVRDREAQRRRDRDQRQHTRQIPVEKDW